ncbi:MAG: cobalamin biosynthesis protein [Alphaproteobacteria bacterium]
MNWPTPPGVYSSAEPLFLLFMALAIEAYLGGLSVRGSWLPQPRRAFARLVRGVERRLNRPERSVTDRRRRGIVAVVGLAVLALVIGALAGLLSRYYPFAWVIELLFLPLILSQRGTWRRGAAVADALKDGSLIRAREELRPLVRERIEAARLDGLDAAGIIEVTIAGIALRFTALLVGPVLWYVLLGLPGLLLQQATYVMDLALGGRAEAFGRAAERMNGLVSAPSRALAALLLAVSAAFVPGGKPLAALRCLPAHRGGPAAALAAAPGAAIGSARLARVLAVFAVACLFQAAIIGLLALLRLSIGQ